MIRRAKNYAEWHSVKGNQANMTEAQRDMAVGSSVMLYLLPPRRKPMNAELRGEIFDRDGTGCRYCGQELTEADFTVDHIVAVASGGTDDQENLTVACRPCNSRKGTK